MCESKDHMHHGCGCSKDAASEKMGESKQTMKEAASGRMEEGKQEMKDAYEKEKEGVKDMAHGVGDKVKSMMDKDKNA